MPNIYLKGTIAMSRETVIAITMAYVKEDDSDPDTNANVTGDAMEEHVQDADLVRIQ